MGRLFAIALEGRFYSCKHCNTHLALADDIRSKSFQCRHGKAYLFDKESAQDHSEKYKEGKFILERFQVLDPDGRAYMIAYEAQVAGSDADDA